MTLTNNFFQSNGKNSGGNKFRHYQTFSKFVVGIALFMVVFFLTAANTNAQRNGDQSICEKAGFSDTRENLDGIWKMTFTSGITKHETFLIIKKQVGLSLTRYYDSTLKRTRRISQLHAVCQAKGGVVILGFEPTDIDTNQKGKDLTYSADNFVISRQTDGTVLAYNRDDAGTTVEIDIEFLEELPSDVKIK